MKKYLLVLAALVGMGVAQVSALGLGAAFTLPIVDGGVNSGVAASFKLDKAAPVLGLGFRFQEQGGYVGLTADWWMAQGNLVDFINFYVGPGAYIGVASFNDTTSLDLGARVPIGLNAYLLKGTMELFLEFAPTIGVEFEPLDFPSVGLQGAFGFRFWF